jgi:hypothetical protein
MKTKSRNIEKLSRRKDRNWKNKKGKPEKSSSTRFWRRINSSNSKSGEDVPTTLS